MRKYLVVAAALLHVACSGSVQGDTGNDLASGDARRGRKKPPATDTPAAEPTPPPTPGPGAAGAADRDPAGIFDGNGNVDANAYRAMAAAYGTPAMIPFRFGNDAGAYGSVDAPTVYAKPLATWENPADPMEVVVYSLGTPQNASSDFSSNEAQVAYVTDNAIADSKPGVDRISTLYMDHGIFSATPQLYWNYRGWGEGHYGRPEQNLLREFVSADRVAAYDAAGGSPSQPVDLARAYGASEAAAHSLMVFQNGFISAGGVATASGTPIYYRPFPASYVPTAASVTNNGELGLVTLWDTEHLQAKLAVFALGGSIPQGGFWGYEWTTLMPGFRNYSRWTFVKLLGYVDLPDMIAPTAVEAVGDALIGIGLGQLPGQQEAGNFSLSNEDNWRCFSERFNDCVSDRHGFALVASRYEKKVTIVDLTPLFARVQHDLFGDYVAYEQHVANVGMGDEEWPPAFAAAPDFAPKVVKTVAFEHQVTAVSASLAADNLGLIATEDGVLHVYDVDGLQTGGSGANAHEARTLAVGRNVTRIAHMKHVAGCCGDGGAIRHQVILVSRGEKRIDWVDLETNAIIRTMRDARLVDPISAEDNNNHGTFADVITVLDYGAKKVRGYRYGPVDFNTNGGAHFDMGENGEDAFEYSGEYDTPTGAFCISIENVT